jgi:lysozyme family protein
MADFTTAFQKLLLLEGGYVNNLSDKGGPTKFGISMRFLQNMGTNPTIATIQSLTVDDASRIYKQEFWDKNNYGAIASQKIADAVFCFAVNAGPTNSHKCLQRCVRPVNGMALVDDGILGFRTMVTINSAPEESILLAFKCFADSYYRSLDKPEFIKGWLNRLYQK